MIDSYLRPPYQSRIVEPLMRLRWLQIFSPNFITFLALCSGLSIAFFLYSHSIYQAFFALLLSGLLDTIDGSLARMKNTASPAGAFFDLFSDRFVEFAIVLGLFLYEPEARALYCILMLGSILLCVTSFLIVGIFSMNSSAKSFHYSPGIIERAEAFIFFSCMILLPDQFVPLAVIFTVLVFITGIIRLQEFTRKRL